MTVTQQLIEAFPPEVELNIYRRPLMEKQYKIGYEYKGRIYLPGSGSYYPLNLALMHCLRAFEKNEQIQVDLDLESFVMAEIREDLAKQIGARMDDYIIQNGMEIIDDDSIDKNTLTAIFHAARDIAAEYLKDKLEQKEK